MVHVCANAINGRLLHTEMLRPDNLEVFLAFDRWVYETGMMNITKKYLEIGVVISAAVAIWTTELVEKLIKLSPVFGLLCEAAMLARQDVLGSVSSRSISWSGWMCLPRRNHQTYPCSSRSIPALDLCGQAFCVAMP